MKVWELIDLLEKNYELNGHASLRNARYQWRHVLRLLGDSDSEKVRAGDIETYKAKRVKEGAARGTVNNELALLLRSYNLAKQQELIYRSPPIQKFRVHNARQGFVRPDVFWKIFATLQVLDEDVADAFMCSYLLGWRRGMVLGMTWSEVDVKAKRVQLPAQRCKNRKALTVTLEGETLKLFQRRDGKRNGEHVFHREGKPIRDFRGVWNRARVAAKVPDLRFHDSRRAFCVNAFAAGWSVNHIMAVGGWSTNSMVLRYGIPDEERIREDLSRLSDYVKDGAPKNGHTSHGRNP